jgi:4-aminobutyrate aminotransferase
MGDLYERDLRALAAVQRLRFFPLAAVGGQGSWLFADDGRRLLDLSASWGSASLGYGHPAVTAAITATSASPAGSTGLSVANQHAVEFAEQLLGTLPEPLSTASSVYLGHAGSDANSVVIRAARLASGRRLVASFGGSYHGGLGEAHDASGFQIERAGGLNGHEDRVLLPYPVTGEQRDQVLARMDAALASCDVAVVLVEPLLSDGGVYPPASGFLAGLGRLCTATGTLLAVDEVKVGIGRTGSLHAFSSEGVVPDAIIFGKGIGGCLPLSAAVAPRAIFDAAPAALLLTTAGNPICAAAGSAVLRTVIAEQLPEHAKLVGQRIRDGLVALVAEQPVLREVRGRGLSLGLEIDDAEVPGGAATFTAMLVYRCWELGAVMYPVGPTSSVVELTPPLVLTANEADLAVELIDQAVTDVLAGHVRADAVAQYQGW